MGTSTAHYDQRNRVRSKKLPPVAGAPGIAKDLVRHWLWEHGWSDDPKHPKYRRTVYDALVVTSEFVTNVGRHVKAECTLIFDLNDEGNPVIAVWDPSPIMPSFPEPIDPEHAAEQLLERLEDDELTPESFEHGRGLSLVASLAKECGVGRWLYGKLVWAVLNIDT